MYHTTGLDKAEILDLCEMIHQESVSRRTDLAADSRTVQVGRGHPDVLAPESGAG